MSLFNSGSGTKEENRRTIIAVVLSTVIVGVGFMIQNAFFPPTAAPASQPASSQAAPTGQNAPQSAPSATSLVAASPEAAKAPVSGVPAPAPGAAAGTSAAQGAEIIAAPAAEQRIKVETDLFDAEFTNAGGDLVSLKLKKHKDKSGYVDLIVPGSAGSSGLALSFGNRAAAPVRDLMSVRWLGDDRKTIEFSRTFYASVAGRAEPVSFTYRKAYTFRDGEYMFGLAVTLENSLNEFLPLNQDGMAYTLNLGPQIGPRFDHLSKNADFRKYITEVGGKKRQETVKAGTPFTPKDQPTWAAIAGKYFAFIAIPEAPFASFSFLQGTDPDIKQTNSMSLMRPAIQASRQTDTYYFYFGPKTATELSKYEYADKNAFGRSALRLEDAMERSNILGWLESILKFFLNIFYKVIPNYGIAIILVTILMKVVLFPLTRKGSIGSARMQELQPRIAELQAKYKGNPQKLNQEMAEFYKRENYNPMSGCLPMLIQFPLFIAMYNLFNNHFDLRGAMFIPGWIPDLSLPESLVNFGNFRLPLLGWNDLRALPIIYLGSQLLYGKFQPTAPSGSGQNAGQMKMMMYGMPVMFFFILYDVPSGLLLYWIASNVLTILQQIVINDMLKKHKIKSVEAAAAAQASSQGTTSAPPVYARQAGKTVVRSKGANQDNRGFSEKTRDWLERKAAEASGKQDGATKPGTGDKDGKGSGGAAGKRR